MNQLEKITLRQSPWDWYEKQCAEDNCVQCGSVYSHLPSAYYAEHCLCPACLHNETGEEWEDAIRSNLGQRDTGELEEFEAQMIEFFSVRWFADRGIFYNETTKELWQH